MNKSTGLLDINSYQPLIVISLFVVTGLTLIIVYRGIDSARNYVYVLILLPYFLLLILLIKGITLPGFWKGWIYLFRPDWPKLLSLKVWTEASNQAMYSIGLAEMTMIMISSHRSDSDPLFLSTVSIPCMNFATSILGAMTLF